MASLDVFQDPADQHATTATTATTTNESDHHPQQSSPVETPLEPSLSSEADTQDADADISGLLRRSHSSGELRNGDPAPAGEFYTTKDRAIVSLQRTLTDLQTAGRSKDSDLRGAKQELNKALAGQYKGIVRLQATLTDLQTANESKDVELRGAKQDLLNAREELNKALAEQSSLKEQANSLKETADTLREESNNLRQESDTLRQEADTFKEEANTFREEMSTLKEDLEAMKQTISEHQAIVYRKDIELFALRKANEQKEKSIRERDASVDEAFRQQHTALELKEAQLTMLKSRLEAAERQNSPKLESDDGSLSDGDQALEVRLLRVRKRQKFSEAVDEKDAIIAKLQEELAAAKLAATAEATEVPEAPEASDVTTDKTSEDVVNQQAELQRAWDINKKIQTALKEERERHDKTKAHLQELTGQLEEQDTLKPDRRGSAGRLSTIEEQDQNELEAMFDATQQENGRLNGQVEALEKRVRDANARVFTAEQEITTLREQIVQEKAINSDLSTARPSVVHRVHFQRMERQLREARDALTKKEDAFVGLKTTLSEKTSQLETAQKEAKREKRKSMGVREEVEKLQRAVADLENTKERLMHDQDRSAGVRSRQRTVKRVSSNEFTSARCSGQTLVTENSPPQLAPATGAEPVPSITPLSGSTARSMSVQEVPRKHTRQASEVARDVKKEGPIPSKDSLSDLKGIKQQRRKSLGGFRDLMKRIVKKESSQEVMPINPRLAELSKERPKAIKVQTAPLISPMPSPLPLLQPARSKSQRSAKLQKSRPHTSSGDYQPSPINDFTESTQDHSPFLRPRSFMSNSTPRRRATLDSPIIPSRFSSRKDPEIQLFRPRTASLPDATRPSTGRRLSHPRYYAGSPTITDDERPMTAMAEKAQEKRRKHDSGVNMADAEADAERMRPLSRVSWSSAAATGRKRVSLQ